MTELHGVGWRYLLRLGAVGVIFALVFYWLLRLPFTRESESFGHSLDPKGPFASVQQAPGNAHFL